MTESECSSLHVWCDGYQCVSVWKATFIERLKILFTGKVWLGVLSGKTQPPVFVSGECVFEKSPIIARFKAFIAQVKETITEIWKRATEAAKQPDKRKHFIVGAVISLVIGSLLGFWVGLLAAILAGAAKEWWDSKGHGTVEWLDFAFTAFGGLCATPLSFFIHWLI